MTDFEALRRRMVEDQLVSRGIRERSVLAAMSRVPREEFVPAELRRHAYEDGPLSIGADQTISQPYIVALMAEALELTPQDRVLEVGAGSGYAAAVIGEIASEVFAIERHESLARAARERIERLGIDNVHVLVGDGTEGLPRHAPFDAIVAAAAGPRIPQTLLEQLAEGGRLVMPVGPTPHDQTLVRVTRTSSGYERERLEAVRFVPLIGKEGWPEG